MSGLPLQDVVERIGEIQPRLPAGTSLGIGLAALLVVGFPVTWMFVRYLNTMAHEGSHAIVYSLLGFRITGVWLWLKDANGATKAEGQGRAIPSGLVGYLGPSLFGLGAAKLISTGHSVAVLWLALGLLGVLLVFVRNVFGILVTLLAGFVIFDVARYGTVAHETMAAYGVAWLLLLTGVRVVLMHWNEAGDAKILQAQTQIMPVVFARIWLIGTILALMLGAKLMT